MPMAMLVNRWGDAVANARMVTPATSGDMRSTEATYVSCGRRNMSAVEERLSKRTRSHTDSKRITMPRAAGSKLHSAAA